MLPIIFKFAIWYLNHFRWLFLRTSYFTFKLISIALNILDIYKFKNCGPTAAAKVTISNFYVNVLKFMWVSIYLNATSNDFFETTIFNYYLSRRLKIFIGSIFCKTKLDTRELWIKLTTFLEVSFRYLHWKWILKDHWLQLLLFHLAILHLKTYVVVSIHNYSMI